MIFFYICAVVARVIAPYADYINAMHMYRGCLEAAPACLASGVIAGLLGDLMMRRGKAEDDE